VLLRTQPDERLVALSRDGGSPAFDEIVRRYGSALTAFAGSVAPPSRAEDVVQESLLKAYVALQDGAEPDLLRAWLFRIVRNTAIDEQRGTHHYEQLDENHDGVEQPPQALERREQLAGLMLALQDLPAGQRDAIVQRELEGRGHAEIAHAMKLTPGSVRQLIYRARHSLRSAAGVMIPAVLIRAASVPGAGEAVGGLGAAGALKLGLATVVATTAIVAGTSVDRGANQGTAEALQLSTPQRDQGGAVLQDAGAGGSSEPADGRGGDGSRSGPSESNSSGKGESGGHGPSGANDGPGSGASGPGESGDDGLTSNSGPGSESSGEPEPGDDSGSMVSGGGDDGTSGEGSGTDDGKTLVETEGSGSGSGSGSSGPG
jgi:RNA polymerase sigma factor (sigma-70 family)